MGIALSTHEPNGHEPNDHLRENLRRHVQRSPELSTIERAARDLLAALGADGVKTVTSVSHGLVRDGPCTRQEFLIMTGGRSR